MEKTKFEEFQRVMGTTAPMAIARARGLFNDVYAVMEVSMKQFAVTCSRFHIKRDQLCQESVHRV